VPGFIVGLESCVVDAALEPPPRSNGFKPAGCNAWACATCKVCARVCVYV
jgi:hypothetical protein